MSSALLGERTVVVTPTLVRAVGGSVTRAAVLQQIHWHTLEHTKATRDRDGQVWVALTYAELGSDIGLSAEQVRRAAVWLESPRRRDARSCEPFLEVDQPEGYCRRKWYRVRYEHPALSDSSNRRNRHQEAARTPSRSGGSDVTSSTDSKKNETPPNPHDVGAQGRRVDGTNPRAVRAAPRDRGTNPRAGEYDAFFADVRREPVLVGTQLERMRDALERCLGPGAAAAHSSASEGARP